MAQDRDDHDAPAKAPSLEPPSLFKRGKKQRKAASAPPPPPPPSPTSSAEPPPRPEPVRPVAAPPPRVRPPAPPSRPAPAAEPAADPAANPAAERVADESLDTPREHPVREPWLVGRPAAVLTGFIVGALVVALTAGSQRACSAIRGTSTCGGSGFFLLVAILVVAVLVGAALLRAARVPQPGSTSFLAVGLLSVVALLFLVDALFEWWMVIAIPLVAVATFTLSHWVTTTYTEPEDDASDPAAEPERHDVR